MTAIEKELADRNDRLCLLLGIATTMIFLGDRASVGKDWWMHAIEEVVYKNNPVPEINSKDV